MSDDSSGDSNFVATIVVASLCWVVSIVQKEEREKDRQRETKGRNFVIEGFQGKGKRGFSSILVKRGLVGGWVAISLKGLVVNRLPRFLGFGGAYENNHFLKQRKRIVQR